MQQYLRRYDHESVVFNPHTWQTHVLNAAAALVFELLCEQPHSLESLHATLTEELSPQDMQVLDEDSLRQLLDELESLRLLATKLQ